MTLLALVVALALAPAWAEKAGAPQAPKTTDPGPAGLTAEVIQGHIRQINKAKDLADGVRKSLIDSCEAAAAKLQVAKDWAGKLAAFEKARKSAPALLKEIQADLAKPQAEPEAKPPPDASLKQIENLLTKAEMEAISEIDRNCRLIKGHVFLWKEGQTWEDLWDKGGSITPP